MKKRTFDFIVILAMALILVLLNEFDLLQKYSYFTMVLILAAYYLGQYREKHYKSS